MRWTTNSPDIVLFGIIPWGPGWQRPHHFARQLIARGHRVVYVTPHVALDGDTWRDLGRAEDLARAGAGAEGEVWAARAARLVRAQLAARQKDSIHSSTPWIDEDLQHAHHCFRRMVHDLRLRAPILLSQSPGWWPLLAYIRERSEFPLVYDCLDEHVGWNHEMSDRVKTWEEALAAAADLVLASAPRLQARLARVAPDVRLVPNGCDAGHFATAAGPNGVLKSLRPGPVIGYYGAISAGWFDTALVVTLAESRPEWSFVCIGPADEGVREQLDGSPNVLLLGEVPYADLPRYAADFDVAIIPFLVNDLTAAVDPVKLYEYFAAEKPVVITPLPAAYELQGLLCVAEDAVAFERAIARFLAHPGDGAERSRLARGASWGRRVEGFYPAMLGSLPTLDVRVIVDAWSPEIQRAIESIRGDGSYEARLIVVDQTGDAAVPAYVRALVADGAAVMVQSARFGDDGTAHEVAAPGLGTQQRDDAGRCRQSDYVLFVEEPVELPPGTLLGLVSVLMSAPDVRRATARSDRLETGGTRYQPRFGHWDDLVAFFGEYAWDHFGAEADGVWSGGAVTIFRRRDVPGVTITGGASDRAGTMAPDRGPSIVACGVLVHEIVGHAMGLDPAVYRALVDRERRRQSAQIENSCAGPSTSPSDRRA